MRVTFASRPATATTVNEDLILACPTIVVVLDGAGMPEELDTGCRHGTAWFVAQLGATLLDRLLTAPGGELADHLGDAIEHVASLHGTSCDLAHPGTPSAAVAILQERHETVEYLVLADCTIALGRERGIQVVTDDRISQVALAERGSGASWSQVVTAERGQRNRDGGYWVAATDPAAAEHAITGQVARHELRRATILTDGAARLVQRFHLATWREALALVGRHGPGALIRQVRQAEHSDPNGIQWPRSKCHDDASVADCTVVESE